jgi:hypothetical protein
MPEARFYAQVLVETHVDGDRAELSFVNESGEVFHLSLPLVVATALAPVLTKLEKEARPNLRHVEHLEKWGIGHSNEVNSVILFLNDLVPLALHASRIPELLAAIRSESEALRQAPSSTLQ